ncbi:Inosine-uridine nucleoside N-ribohydrolase [Pseudarthrobacter phenanthrenivorans Sphe3]|uniref:Inosine-uridine nucleoside N-ribohydrolase n=1 Tax=Pseudarthrobacter phenanthrenivorans (strain DSM 18606 / JCM 16027 / LMG 23796 / Sphe3) TaxID=930171 RepID=F0M9S2_PSEPM|nr:nucleoside hydrolase [Pseudarthrobacter phenanthrenivorans]ADX72792.1 Inosine-uridine nucleoside N-ribohydrolase [Pseudarthrobacter phenanthrenivorans Sphe3]
MTAFLLDVDTGIDDALAIAYLAALPDTEFVSVTATPGNVDADQVARNTLALLELCGRPGVEVAIGARGPLAIPLLTTPETHGPQGIGYAVLPDPAGAVSGRNAVDLWVEHARARPGELTALITAPLTNFALALRQEPRLPELLAKVVIMGGSFYYQGNTTPTAEWNTHVDPHAAKEVYAAFAGQPLEKLPIVCSLDTTERMELHPAHLRQLAEAAGAGVPEDVLPEQPEGLHSTSDNLLVRHLSDALRFYFEFHRRYDQGYLAHVHDYFAAGVAAGTLDFQARPAAVDVETGSEMLMGTTVADFRGLWGRPPNARVVSLNYPGAAFRELVSSVGRLARSVGQG